MSRLTKGKARNYILPSHDEIVSNYEQAYILKRNRELDILDKQQLIALIIALEMSNKSFKKLIEEFTEMLI